MKTYIISNRLPARFVQKKNGKFDMVPSEGGLATGLASLKGEQHWIGWPGISTNNKEKQKEIRASLGKTMEPVFLSEEDIELFYKGFSNETIWPLFHSFTETALFRKEYWEKYVEVNRKFARIVLEKVEPGDTIWIQDYHLMLLPQMLKTHLPDNPIAFFLHIPFPPEEIFNNLPWREEVLQGLLGADLIGFHVNAYLKNFEKAIKSTLQLHTRRENRILNEAKGEPHQAVFVGVGNRTVKARAFPMGIDFDKFNNSINDRKVCEQLQAFKKKFGDFKLILSVDRLDYTKGIPQRIRAFDSLLRQNPELQGKISMVVLVVPSRDEVPRYKMLKEEIDELIGKINGRYSTLDWTPVHYFYRGLDFNQLTALYNLCDIGFVTPYRDGMNLVCKEYVASKTEGEKGGVLILSETAGAAAELTQAIIVNPFHEEEVVAALEQAINMPESKQKKAIWQMQQTIKENSVETWASTILEDLKVTVAELAHGQLRKVIGINQKQTQKNGFYRGVGYSRRPVS